VTINYTNTYFFTATILEWKHLLNDDKYKGIILNSLRFLVDDKRVIIFGFVIMPNHIHIIWHILDEKSKNLTQGSLLRFTAQKIKYDLREYNSQYLEGFKVNAKDREFQIWKRNPLWVEILTDKVMEQKLNYIHENPAHEKWKLVENPEHYYYSSARFYSKGVDPFGFLTSYMQV
jgi:REP element-mobilizing transposase RayT